MTTIKFQNDERQFIIPTTLIPQESYLKALVNFTHSNIITLNCTYEEFQPIYQTITNQISLNKYYEISIDRDYYGVNLPYYDNLLKFHIDKLSNFLSTPMGIFMVNNLDEYINYKKNMPEYIIPFQTITISKRKYYPRAKKINLNQKIEVNRDVHYLWTSFHDGIPINTGKKNKLSNKIINVLSNKLKNGYYLSNITLSFIKEMIDSYKNSGDEITLCQNLMEIYRGVKYDEAKSDCSGENTTIRYIAFNHQPYRYSEKLPIHHGEYIKKASKIFYKLSVDTKYYTHKVKTIKYKKCVHSQQCGKRRNIKLHVGFINVLTK